MHLTLAVDKKHVFVISSISRSFSVSIYIFYVSASEQQNHLHSEVCITALTELQTNTILQPSLEKWKYTVMFSYNGFRIVAKG